MIVNENRRLKLLFCGNWVWDIICETMNLICSIVVTVPGVILAHLKLSFTIISLVNRCCPEQWHWMATAVTPRTCYSLGHLQYGLLACVPVISLIVARPEIINAVISRVCAWSGHWTYGHCGFLLSLPSLLDLSSPKLGNVCHRLCRCSVYEWLNQILKAN